MITLEKIPNKMKALVLHGIGDLRLNDVDIPKMQKDCVLLKIKACGICSSDIDRVFVNGTYHFPTIPGHEFCGQIVGVQEEDQSLLGKCAAVFPLLPCKECEPCKIGEYAQCTNYNYFGSRCDGAFSEYLIVPKWNLVFFEQIDFKIAALCEPTAVALHSLKYIEINKNKNYFILGSGTIGLLIALILKSKNCNVYVGARKKEAMKFIESLGLIPINTTCLENEIKEKSGNEGFDFVFEAIGSNESISMAIKSANSFAKIVLVGNPKEDLKIEKNVYWKILRKQLSLSGTWNSNFNQKVNDWKMALEFIKSNNDIVNKLITDIYSLEEYESAFNLLKNKEKFKIKVMFEMEKKDEKR